MAGFRSQPIPYRLRPFRLVCCSVENSANLDAFEDATDLKCNEESVTLSPHDHPQKSGQQTHFQ